MQIARRILLLLMHGLILACSDPSLNNPYPATESNRNIYYDTFSKRPKHLDPALSYSANEYVFLGQIYEPPLQYHFLKRPYQLIPLTATEMPVAIYQDSAGNVIDEDSPAEKVSKVIYKITIKPDIFFQPHPALATDKIGDYDYHNLEESDLKGIHSLADFKEAGTRVLTSADYVYQIKRMAHPKIHSPIAGLMSQYILGLSELSKQLEEDFKISGEEVSSYIDLRKYDFAGARIIDDTTFEIVLKEKYPQFLYWLSMSFFAPMPWEADLFYTQAGMTDRNITLDWYPIGTGPFMLTENNPNRQMVLDRNPNFRGEIFPLVGEENDMTLGLLEDAGKVMPFIDKAIFSLEKESIPTWNKFLQGYYDTSGIASDSFDQAVQFNVQGEAGLTEEMQEKDIQLMTAVTTSTFYTGFNMHDEVVGGESERARLLRQAIAIAIDFEEFISIFANGRGVSAQGPVPPGIFGYEAGEAGINPYVYDWIDDKPKRKSIDIARQLMIEAGYPGGRNMETGQGLVLYLDTPATSPESKVNFDWLRKQFNKLGITLVIRATDYNRFQDKMLKGTAQIYQWGWNADYPDPENFMFLLYGANAKFQINGENASNYKNEEFDQLFDQMKNMSNGESRQLIINRMVEIVRRDSPWLWGYHPVAFSLHHDWYKNAKPNLMANNKLKYKRIDPVKREVQREKWNRSVWWPVILIVVIFGLSIIPAIRYHQRRERSAAL